MGQGLQLAALFKTSTWSLRAVVSHWLHCSRSLLDHYGSRSHNDHIVQNLYLITTGRGLSLAALFKVFAWSLWVKVSQWPHCSKSLSDHHGSVPDQYVSRSLTVCNASRSHPDHYGSRFLTVCIVQDLCQITIGQGLTLAALFKISSWSLWVKVSNWLHCSRSLPHHYGSGSHTDGIVQDLYLITIVTVSNWLHCPRFKLAVMY